MMVGKCDRDDSRYLVKFHDQFGGNTGRCVLNDNDKTSIFTRRMDFGSVHRLDLVPDGLKCFK